MKLLLVFLSLGLLSVASFGATKEVPSLKVIAVHQIDDESKAAFDFFSSDYVHDCGGKPSNRFRSYSRNEAVTERKFLLVLAALEQGYQLSTDVLGCEGNAMKVSRIGVRR